MPLKLGMLGLWHAHADGLVRQVAAHPDEFRLAGFFDRDPAVVAARTREWSPRVPDFRVFDAPEALGISFHEVEARSAINAVPERSRMPFRFTINPHRGCTHACVYCFARPTHTYLDLNAREDFEREIVAPDETEEVLTRLWPGVGIGTRGSVGCATLGTTLQDHQQRRQQSATWTCFAPTKPSLPVPPPL